MICKIGGLYMLKFWTVLFSVIFVSVATSQVTNDKVNDYLKTTLDYSLKQKENMINKWKEKYTKPQDPEIENSIELIGYQPPDFLVSIADISSFLYEKKGNKKYAEITRDLIVSLEGYRKYFPKRFRDRVEYREGIPVVNWFRTLPMFTKCYQRTKDSGVKHAVEILFP